MIGENVTGVRSAITKAGARRRLMRITSAFVFLMFVTGCSSTVGPVGGSGAGGKGPGSGSTGSTGGGTTTGGAGGGPGPIPPRLEPGTCGLQQPAFCEKFNTPMPGGRGGDL